MRWQDWLNGSAAVAMIAASGVFVWAVVVGSRPNDERPDTRGKVARPNKVALPTEPVALLTGHVLGKETARSAIIVFSDFECPYCGKFARDTMPEVRSRLVETGIARLTFRHLPLEKIHRRAFDAAVAAECAGKHGRFWQMHDALFATPGKLSDQDLLRYSNDSGVTHKAFTSCVGSDLSATVREDIAEATRLGITGTPTFFVGSIERDGRVRVKYRQSGAVPFNVLAKMVSVESASASR